MLTHTLAQLAGTVFSQLPPNPAPVAPPGAEKITEILGYVKWGAGIALIIAFFGGLAIFTGGRLVDHHHIGRIGTVTMIAALFGGILYAMGYTLLASFAA